MRVSKEKAVELATKRVEKVKLYFERAKAKYEDVQHKLANAELALSESKNPSTPVKSEKVINVPVVSEFA